MFNIKTLNKISKAGLSVLNNTNFTVGDACENPDGIIVRSADMHSLELPSSLLCIARAGAGTNNIPVDRCAEAGIVVFNTPGANANAVKELTICSLFLASRDIAGGIAWANSIADKGDEVAALVEKGKSAYVGPEIEGKVLGVLGLGAIGAKVANTAAALGMTVYGYDPFLSVDSAWSLSNSVRRAMSLEAIYKNCDYISLHLPANSETKGMINSATISMMKDNVRIVNFARGELVKDADMAAALESGKVARYVTDFPNGNIIKAKNVVAIPHLGASTPESEENCAEMASAQLKDYLENGNIRNSVNFPNVEMDRSSGFRLCVVHRNTPDMLNSVTSVLASDNISVGNTMNKSKKDYAYTILDLSSNVNGGTVDKLLKVDGVLKVRVIA